LKKKVIKISDKQDGERLDIALVQCDLGLSRRKIRQIIDNGGCYVNRKRVRVASKKVTTGMDIELVYSESSVVHQKKTLSFNEKNILRNEPSYVAINKPWGVPSQATLDQSLVHVASLTRKYLTEVLSEKLSSAVAPAHRLDMETTGVMLLGKSNQFTQNLMDQFRERTTKKVYHAICFGIPEKKQFQLDCQLSVIDKKTRTVRVIQNGGKNAVTDFRVIGKSLEHNMSLIECHPITGRTHQLRVQLSYLGFPIVGDKKYINRKIEMPAELSDVHTAGHYLHARYLAFHNPETGEAVQVAAPYFEEFDKVCKKLKLTY
jgi:RluA family pseudouridine synthase